VPPPWRTISGQRGTATEHGAAHVDQKDPIPHLERHVLDIHVALGHGQIRGVVVQNIESPKFGHHRAEEHRDRVLISQIQGQRQRARATGAQCRSGRLHVLHPRSGQYDARTGLRQRLGSGQSDASRCPGNNRYLSLQCAHR
jgi:hypothetical protein